MEKVDAKKLKGFQDYPPALMRLRWHIMDTVREFAHHAGFEPIGTPALEYADTLLGTGGETDKQVYKFLDNGDRMVALRFDLTVPFARYIGEHQGTMTFPFKRLHIGDVWRAEKPQKGRFREFAQCDLDIIGADTWSCDLEVMATFLSTLHALVPGGFRMALGHRPLLSALIRQSLGIYTPEGEAKALILLDKLGKIGKDALIDLMAIELAVTPDAAGELIRLVSQDFSCPHVLDALGAWFGKDPTCQAHWQRLRHTLEALQQHAQELPRAQVCVDLSIARGLGYYTGIVFETTLTEAPQYGSICSGGRYDHLAERFTDRSLPGVGGSLGLDRLCSALMEQGSVGLPPKARLFIAIADDQARPYAHKTAFRLRRLGIPTHINMHPQKLAAQFKHGSKQGYWGVLVLGEAEAHQGSYSLKHMESGLEQKHLSWEGLQAALKPTFAPSAEGPVT